MKHCFIYICGMKKIENLLKENGLKITPSRTSALETIYSSRVALKSSEIEALHADLDRVTLYRTLNALENAGLVHRIIDDVGNVKYAGCAKDCDHHKAHDLHLHFKCEVCDDTVCLEDVEVFPPKLPDGYILNQLFTTATGICKSCA